MDKAAVKLMNFFIQIRVKNKIIHFKPGDILAQLIPIQLQDYEYKVELNDQDVEYYKQINAGKFIVRWIDTSNAMLYERELKEGDTWHNPPLQPHQLEAIDPMSSITEVSTPDSVEDNFRLIPGDSQQVETP